MATVFISYARKDRDFAELLAGELTGRGHGVWLDFEDIGPAAPWRAAIVDGIDAADAVVVVLTPDWAGSALAVAEIDVATERGKRVIPVVRIYPDPATLPAAISELNWIALDETVERETGLRALFQAVEQDREWVREHTRLLNLAEEWRRNGADPAYLLRGKALKRAEAWLSRGAGKQSPRVTDLQASFVVASGRRRRVPLSRRSAPQNIFISYRRSDAEASAGRLADALTAVVGAERVFLDVTRVDPGVDFMTTLEQALDSTAVLVIIIGLRWLEPRGPEGQTRLADPADLVRVEIATALARGIAVIPVLVDGARMPTIDDLPDPLRELSRRQAIAMNHEHWHRDVEHLMAAMPTDVVRSARRTGRWKKLR